ncbi:MAG TPA: MFS transporter [Caldilineaceae bacterium]|nr:MFS transporter [Caldilineaceae bacterium]
MFLRKRLLSRLLLLDQPVPARPPREVELEATRNYRWNFVVNVLDGLAFWFGLAFVSSSTIVPLFVSKITLNPLVIGLVAMVAQASWYIPQLFTADQIERLDRKKPVVINAGFFLERLPVWLWPVAAYFAADYPMAALTLFIVSYAWHGLGAGMIGPAWQDLLARCFPVEKRGWLFGFTTFAGTGAAALGAGLSSWLLRELAYPFNFVVLFSIAAVAITLSWAALAFVREPLQAGHREPSTSANRWARMAAIIREDHNFRSYLGARMLLVLGTMGSGFVTVITVERWDVPDAVVGVYTAVLLLGQTVGNLLAGLIADRRGHKLPLLMGGAAQVTGFTIALVTPVAEGMVAVYALIGFAVGVNIVSGILIALEFAPPERRPSYVGIANTAVGVASGLAPLLGGWIATLGYTWLFGASALVGGAALVWLFLGVADPRRQALSSALSESV